MKKEYTAFHGTTSEAAKEIVSTNKYIINEDKRGKLFLGKGIYFYIEYRDAISWNIKRYREKEKKYPNIEELNKEYDIIQSELIVPEDNILDLDDIENLKIFDELTEKIKGKLKTKQEYIYAQNKNGAIINYLKKLKMLDGVDIIKRSIRDSIIVSEIHSINDIYRQVICVKNLNIIKENVIKEKVTEEDFRIVNYFYGDKVR